MCTLSSRPLAARSAGMELAAFPRGILQMCVIAGIMRDGC